VRYGWSGLGGSGVHWMSALGMGGMYWVRLGKGTFAFFEYGTTPSTTSSVGMT
jgi:hypothetical protein